MERLGLEVNFVGGRRVTTEAGSRSSASRSPPSTRSSARRSGSLAVPLFGDEIGLQATPVPELGLVGEALPSRPAAVVGALAAGQIPVVAPLAEGPLNVNADEAAAALAVGLGAERILFVTDVPGLLLGGAVAATIRGAEAERLLDEGELTGGIVPKLRAAIGAARGGVEAEDRRDGGGRMTTRDAQPRCCPPTRAHDVTFVSGEGAWLVDDGRKALPRPARRDRGRRPRPLPSGAARGRAGAARHALARLEPLRDRAAGRLAGLLSDRFGGARAFFCNSGAEAVEAALKWARKVTGKPEVVALENSFHGRTHGALAVTGQPAKRAAWEPLAPAARFAHLNDVESLAAARRAGDGRDPDRAGSGRGRDPPGDARVPRRRAHARRRARRAAPPRRGAERRRPHGQLLRLGAARASRRTRSTLAKGLATGCRSGRCSSPTARRRARAGRPRQHVRRQPGRLRRCVRGRRDDRRRAARVGAHARRAARRRPRRAPRRRRGPRPRPAARRRARPSRRPRRRRLPRRRPARRHRGRATVLRLTPPLTIADEELELGLALLEEVLT